VELGHAYIQDQPSFQCYTVQRVRDAVPEFSTATYMFHNNALYKTPDFTFQGRADGHIQVPYFYNFGDIGIARMITLKWIL
jgi:hypothetical protein